MAGAEELGTLDPSPRADDSPGQNEVVSLARVAWVTTVIGFVVAALLLLLNGYFGYFLVLLAVAFSASVNLLR